MNLLGIDLGIHKVSFALFIDQLMAHAVSFHVGGEVARDQVLAELGYISHDFALQHDVDQVWIEDVLVGNNPKYSLQLAETKGAVLADLSTLRRLQGTDIRMVGNKTWKKAVVGNGNASKDTVKDYIHVTYPAYAPLCGDDQDLYDATCIGLYGLQIAERASSLTLVDASEQLPAG